MSEQEHDETPFGTADASGGDEPLGIEDATESEATDAEKVERELEDLRSRLLRTTADYQNFVKRSQANQQAAVEQRVMSITRDLVAVIDHFDRALQLDAEAVSAEDVMKGIESVRGEFVRVLGKYGVEPISPEVGEPFDPNLHEALMRAEAEGVATDHVVAVLQGGYKLGDKPIRPAGVSVAP
ncbi:MAG: nucleotide exchange factor GrpE [Planctomycetota bacterium]